MANTSAAQDKSKSLNRKVRKQINNKIDSQYHMPTIYKGIIDKYFNEGPYPTLEVNQTPKPGFCTDGRKQCYDTGNASPLNVNDVDPVNPPPDTTVENNIIIFADNMEISSTTDLSSATKYNENDVLGQIIIHEMGHALLTNKDSDHCQNSKCPLCAFTTDYDYETKTFGAGGSCTHGEDLKQDNIIKDSKH